MGIRALAGRVNRACARPEEQLRGCESIAAQAHLLDGPNLGLVQLLQPIGDRVINLESIVGRKKGACRRESARRCGRDRRGGRCRRHANSSKRTSATTSLDFFGIFSRSSQGCRRLLAWRNQRLLSSSHKGVTGGAPPLHGESCDDELGCVGSWVVNCRAGSGKTLTRRASGRTNAVGSARARCDGRGALG